MSARDVAEINLPAGIVRIELPMTGNPLGYVNGYLLEGADGYSLIDCGWDLPDVWDALVAGLARVDLTVNSITDLLCTHFHPDHYGLAGRLERTVGARLSMHHLDWDVVNDRAADPKFSDDASDRWFGRNGFTIAPEASETFRENMRYSVIEPTRFLADGDVLALADGAL
ncbi:MAG: MBL fold metallo-hydrolase, partial [Vulcanimicrobiaceae bacterium]